MARNKLRKEKELNQIKKSTNVFLISFYYIISVVYFSNRICVFYLYFE